MVKSQSNAHWKIFDDGYKKLHKKKVLKSFDICIEVGFFFTETALQENDFFQKE